MTMASHHISDMLSQIHWRKSSCRRNCQKLGYKSGKFTKQTPPNHIVAQTSYLTTQVSVLRLLYPHVTSSYAKPTSTVHSCAPPMCSSFTESVMVTGSDRSGRLGRVIPGLPTSQARSVATTWLRKTHGSLVYLNHQIIGSSDGI